MAAMPKGFFCIAPDLRGFGDTEPLKVDATLGLNDMAQDMLALMKSLPADRFHIVGHSMGGGVVMKMLLLEPALIASATLVNTLSPYGYSGSVDIYGTPCFPDGSPSGAGYAESELISRLACGDRSREHLLSPRNLVEQLYFKPPFVPDNIDSLLNAVLSTRLGDDWYPGNTVKSAYWAGLAAGDRGILNAFSRRYFDASGIANIHPKPPILWLRGTDDLIICDDGAPMHARVRELTDDSTHCPLQPMLGQIRCVLETYRKEGGAFRERIIQNAGHTPFIEKPDEFNRALLDFLHSV